MPSYAFPVRYVAAAAVLLTTVVLPPPAAAKRADAAKRHPAAKSTTGLNFSAAFPFDWCVADKKGKGPPSKFQIFLEESLVRVLIGEEPANWPIPELAGLIAEIRSNAGMGIYVSGLAGEAKTSNAVTRVKTFDGLTGDRWEITVSVSPVPDHAPSKTSILQIEWRRIRRPLPRPKDAGPIDLMVSDGSVGWIQFCAVKFRDGADLFARVISD